MPTNLPTAPTGPAPSPAAPSDRLPAAAAALVERVARTAELATAQPAEKVSVRVDLPDLGMVEVHVALRDGQIQTAFHSNSSEVRETLATAWNGFMSGREGSGHPWAEPVFAPLTPAGTAPADPAGFSFDQSPSGSGGGAARQGQTPAGQFRGAASADPETASAPAPTEESPANHPRRHLRATA